MTSPLLPWRSALLLAAAVFVAIPAVAVMLGDDGESDALVVLAPSSLAPVQDELDDTLAATGIDPPSWVFAGSQSLVAQLADGAPADVIVTADRISFDAALDASGGLTGAVRLAENHLVLAVAPGNPGAVDGIGALADPNLLIGVCAPEVPCGRLAIAALDELDASIAPDTEESSVRALTAKLASGELDAGLIYHSDAIAAGLTTIDVAGLAAFANTYWGAATAEGTPLLAVLTGAEASGALMQAGFQP